jgi:predicted CXXCH cytochrome family protein
MNCRLGALLLAITLVWLPALGLAKAQDPHSPDNQEACTLCHVEKPSSWDDVEKARPLQRENVQELCTGCHEWSPGRDHPIDQPVVSTLDPEGVLPTNDKGKMDCLTCHFPHRRGTHRALLRMEADRICMLCHKDK